MKRNWRSQQQALFIQRFITLVVLFVTIGLLIVGKNYTPAEKKVVPSGGGFSVTSMY